MPDSTIIPSHRYRNAPAAIDWLCNVFGFERHAVYEAEPGIIAHAELTLNSGMFMLGSAKDDEHAVRYQSPNDLGGIETGGIYLVVADIDAVHARAVAAGAPVIRPLQDTPYGSREFAVKDPEGYTWGVGNYDPWAAHS